MQSFNELMMMQLSTFPVGLSAGGFTYSFDESLGTLVRASQSFGPAFAERALTGGRGRFNSGVTYQHTRYSRFEGEQLDNGSIKFYLRHEECCTQGTGGGGGGGGSGSGGGPIATPNGTRLNPPFEGDLIEAALSLEARTDTVAFFANYGVTNRWDVGFVVPLVHTELDATVNATILRLATAANPALHTFETGNSGATQEVFQRSGSASGLGDVILRTKYRFMNLAGGGLAAAADVRLPSGSEEDLLGAGGQAKILLVASGGTDRVVGHTNVGYTLVHGDAPGLGLLSALSGPEPLPDEMNYAAGLEVVAHPRLTIIGDLVGRSLRDAGRLAVSRKSVQYQGIRRPADIPVRRVRAPERSLESRARQRGSQVQPRRRVAHFGESARVAHRLRSAGRPDDHHRPRLRLLTRVERQCGLLQRCGAPAFSSSSLRCPAMTPLRP